jgi:hypothetical protein
MLIFSGLKSRAPTDMHLANCRFDEDWLRILFCVLKKILKTSNKKSFLMRLLDVQGMKPGTKHIEKQRP